MEDFDWYWPLVKLSLHVISCIMLNFICIIYNLKVCAFFRELEWKNFGIMSRLWKINKMFKLINYTYLMPTLKIKVQNSIKRDIYEQILFATVNLGYLN